MEPMRPIRPFRPARLNVLPIKARPSKDRVNGRTKMVYPLRVHVDGWRWQMTFDRKGHANSRAQRLITKHAVGWLFDPINLDMVDPDAGLGDARPLTVFSTTLEYVRSGWPSWKPNTRRHYVRYLSRARRWLLETAAPIPDADLKQALDRFMDEISLRLVLHRTGGSIVYVEQIPDRLSAAVAWLEQWSLPIVDVDAASVRDLLARFDYFVPKHPADVPPPAPTRAMPSTREAMLRHTKSWWNWLRDGGHVSHDPFRAARRTAQAKAAKRAEHEPVDPDVVLSVPQLFRFAEHIAAAHSSGERWRVYPPLLGLGGLRPGEARGLRRRSVELPPAADEDAWGWLVISEQRPTSRSSQFVDPEDRDQMAAPLKGRDVGESRRVPIFPQLVPQLRQHLVRYVDDDPDALVLTGVRGGALDPKWFAARIWEPARSLFVAELRASGSHEERVLRKLQRLRRQDLRHAAASFWLRVPVSPKVAQKWGGWRDLSTFLNVYQGILVGEEDQAAAAASAYLAGLDLPTRD